MVNKERGVLNDGGNVVGKERGANLTNAQQLHRDRAQEYLTVVQSSPLSLNTPYRTVSHCQQATFGEKAKRLHLHVCSANLCGAVSCKRRHRSVTDGEGSWRVAVWWVKRGVRT